MDFLRVKGRHIVDENGAKVFLRGVCFGGWLNMENFITGYPGSESVMRQAVLDELGEERYRAFFDGFLDAFITEDDFVFLKDLGATVVRIPFNYRHFESEDKPGEYDTSGFRRLDRAVAWAKKHGIYVILDLHAAPGWQSEGWHCDNPHGVSLFWEVRHFQERVRDLWTYLASHYKDEPAVAGYNFLNEPDAPEIAVLNKVYREWTAAVRRVDEKHIIFFDGNRTSQIFDGLDEPFDANTVYSSHNYTDATHLARAYPGRVAGERVDYAWMERAFLARNEWLLTREIPSWIGEFGALYDGGVSTPTNADTARLEALRDQLDIFHRYEQHWTIWTYKDIGAQGLVASRADSKYMRLIEPVAALKQRLGLDAWTSRDRGILAAEMCGIVDRLAASLSDYSLDLTRLRNRLLLTGVYSQIAGALAPLYAASFIGETAWEIAEMHREAFAFGNCLQRRELIQLMCEALHRV